MHQLGPLDVLFTVAFLVAAVGVERLLRGRLHWLEDAFWPLRGLWRENHPTPARGVQEDDDARLSWGDGPGGEPPGGQPRSTRERS